MPLEFYLVPNLMTSDPDDYMAVTQAGQTFTIEDIYDRMTHEGSTITKAEALAAFEEIIRGVISFAQEGYNIVTPLFNVSAKVSGVFTGAEDSFDSSRHQVKIHMSLGQRLREATSNVSVKKVQAKERQPIPLYFYDNASETQNEMVTPGGGARLRGTLLKFNEEEVSEGIFFVNTTNGTATKVAGKLLKNKPGELIFLNPALPAGTYRVEVRAMLKNNTQLKAGVLTDELTVS